MVDPKDRLSAMTRQIAAESELTEGELDQIAAAVKYEHIAKEDRNGKKL